MHKEIIFTCLSSHMIVNFGSQCKIIIKQGRQLSIFVFICKFNYFQAIHAMKFSDVKLLIKRQQFRFKLKVLEIIFIK